MNGISKLYDAVARLVNYLTGNPNEMCELDMFEYVLEHFQTPEMCEQAVKRRCSFISFCS